ncbi:MAG: zinc ribbon domain-containing protein [Oscillospiraceae bacterium]|nr:zinc ribbon domain-containing protein [Oscillospiraceae bacterium]
MNLSCKSCGTEVDSGDQFCAGCGKAVEKEPPAKFCTNCGGAFADDAKFCVKCGAQMGIPVQPAQSQPTRPTQASQARPTRPVQPVQPPQPKASKREPVFTDTASSSVVKGVSIGRKIGAALLFGFAALTAFFGLMEEARYEGIPLINIGIAVVVIAVGLAVLKRKAETTMLLAGAGIILSGIGAILYGSAMNRSFEAFLQYGPNSGDPATTFGIVLAFAGVVVLALRFWKAHRRP